MEKGSYTVVVCQYNKDRGWCWGQSIRETLDWRKDREVDLCDSYKWLCRPGVSVLIRPSGSTSSL